MNFRLLPEWAEQDAVMLTWPHQETDWAANLAVVEPVYIELCKAISKQQAVLVVAHNERLQNHITHLLKMAGVDLTFIHFVIAPCNDTWARDHGPLTCAALETSNELKIMDFIFNGWGNKFASVLDNQINQAIVTEIADPAHHYQKSDLVLEGGGIEMNEHGVLLTTSECLLNPNRNPSLSKGDIEQTLTEQLGVTSFLWLDHGYLAGDDTDSHIDTLVRFAPDNTLLYVQCDDRQDEHFDALQRMQSQLREFKTPQGNNYKLIALPWPQAVFNDEGDRLPATYANYLIINNTVLVPTYDDKHDQLALSQIAKAYPHHQVVGINCLPIIHQFGSLHCITMQLPRGFLAGTSK
ncbi:agmatine/peptidylarginine deiminase [Pseudoalteromonas mariniglutinosa]|uniref:agmatine deiminase family protein n=1 Tax=Pseudoalteromonas mariniglutinosa TaxID=206042 RepID=UPI00384DB981